MRYFNDYSSAFSRQADAIAYIRGSDSYCNLRGKVLFYQLYDCVMVQAEIEGLPISNEPCDEPVFGFHIHEGTECSGNRNDAFANAKAHYNPDNCLHPYHAGDMPPLFGVNGSAFLAFVTDRFCVDEIIGRTVIIHRMSDDFHTQPSGNAGEKIGCGIINCGCS